MRPRGRSREYMVSLGPLQDCGERKSWHYKTGEHRPGHVVPLRSFISDSLIGIQLSTEMPIRTSPLVLTSMVQRGRLGGMIVRAS